MTIVPYHLSCEESYPSLSYVHDTRSEAEQGCEEVDGTAVVRRIELDQTLYGQYTSVEADRTDRVGDISDSGDSVRAVVEGIIAVFDLIDENQCPTWYKELERDGLAEAVQRTEWRQSVADTGGQLVSELILRHALPNANHRSSIAFLELYLRTFGDLPSVPETGSNEGWANWVNSYISESKKLLTTRRKAGLFGYLKQNGATGVMRKNDVKIKFSEYNPDINDPHKKYANRHHSETISFVKEYLQRAGVPERADMDDDGLSVCADRL